MSIIATIPVILLAVIVTAFLVRAFSGSKSSIEVMLLGIGVILVGGIIAVDPNSNLNGIEYFIVLIGLALTISGFLKKSNM